MSDINNNNKPGRPPRLMQGLFTLIVGFVFAILIISWAIINFQIERLVAARTSDYARSIAQISANFAAESLLSGDTVQLQMLVDNVAKDRYIRAATIFAEDGQIVAQSGEFPLANTLAEQPTPDGSTESSDVSNTDTEPAVIDNTPNLAVSQNSLPVTASEYIDWQNDIPFVETISFKQVTAGWFKISLNRNLLEQNFRQSILHSQNIILLVAAVLLGTLFFLILRYTSRVKLIARLNHRLIQLNAEELPTNKTEWLQSLRQISDVKFQELPLHSSQSPEPASQWHASKRISESIFCVCHFNMQQQENEQTASCLSQAEYYLQAAAQAFGVQPQGDLLSGSLIPFLDAENRAEAVNEAISLIHLLNALFATLPLSIQIKTIIGSGTLLVLENERGVVTGVSLSNRQTDKINKLISVAKMEETITLGIEEDLLLTQGRFKTLTKTNVALDSICFRLLEVKESIKQRSARQQQYLVENKPV